MRSARGSASGACSGDGGRRHMATAVPAGCMSPWLFHTHSQAPSAAKTTAQTGARAGQDAALRLRPDEAANWPELAQRYIGRKLEDAGVPPGYGRVEREGRAGLSRAVADDARFAQLHVDGSGVIRPGPAPSPRVSNGYRTAQSVDGIVARNGMTQRPPHHQAHHVVPDEVVRKHPLMREAHRRGLFDPDATENIALLAERRANDMVPDKVPGLSEGLPRHQGAHRKYSEQVRRAANAVMDRVLQNYGTPGKIPDEVLQSAADDVRGRAWNILRNWEGTHLD
jgi:hypothetical protein